MALAAPQARAAAPAASVLPSSPSSPSRLRRFAVIGGVLFFSICTLLILVAESGHASPMGLMINIVAAMIPAIFFSCLVIVLDRYERELIRVLLGTFLWGALVAFCFSFALNSLFGIIVADAAGPAAGEFFTIVISAPVVEELAKGAVLLLLYLFLRREFDNILDGIVYGSLVGIGFAMTENVLYFGREYVQGGLAGLGVSFFLRVVLGGLGHAAYTAFIGAGFGIARTTNSALLKLAAPIGGLGAAILMHFAWNLLAAWIIPDQLLGAIETSQPEIFFLFIIAPVLSLVFLGPVLLTLTVIIVIAWRREERIIGEQLRDEVATGVISPEEFARLTYTRRRLAHEWRVFRTLGWRAWHVHEHFHQAAASLAFKKWHQQRGEPPKNDQKSTPEEEYRQRIFALRRQMTPLVTPATAPAA